MMTQVNLNNISQDTFNKLAILSSKNGLSIEDYHEQVLSFWVEFANHWENSQHKTVNKKQQSIPNFQQAVANTPSFLQGLLAMPKIDGHDDLFDRVNDKREIDVDDLYFGENS